MTHRCRSAPRAGVGAGGAPDPSAGEALAEGFSRAVPLGVTEVSVDADGRLVWRRVHREHLRDDPHAVDLREPGELFTEEYAGFVAEQVVKLLSAGTLPAVRAALGGGAAGAPREAARVGG